MKAITFTEFRKNASNFFSEVENGESLLVLRHGKAIAEIYPPSELKSKDPSWKRPGLKLSISGASLSKAILEEREVS